MKRSVVLGAALVATVAAATTVWVEVRQEREFRRLLVQGDAALAQNQTFEAIEAFSGALAFKPESMVAHLKRGETYRRRGDNDLRAALRDAREANALDPTAPQPLELLGDVASALGQYDEAVDYYTRYLQLDDLGGRVLYKLALAHVRVGDAARAIEPLRAALALDDRFAEARYLLGVALRAGGRIDTAQNELRRAVALKGTLIPAREELADLYTSRGRFRDAIEQLEAVAALEPERSERLVNVALLYSRWGRHDTAILTLGRAAERHPDSQEVIAAIGRVWLDAASSDDNEVAFARAVAALEPLAARPDATSESLTLLGRAHLMAGRPRAAERMLQRAVARHPIAADAYLHLEEAARRLGHGPLAREAAARHALLAFGS